MRRVTLLGLIALWLAAGVLAQTRKPQEIDLQAAIRTETVAGDLHGAIAQYKAIVAKYPADRVIAATALIRLAGCYQMLGDAEATRIYELVLRDYRDQPDATAVARTRVGPVNQGAQGTLATRRLLDRGGSRDRVSPDGRYVARPDNTGNLIVLELATGKVRALTSDGSSKDPDHRFALSSVFSRDGDRIAYDWYTEIDDRSVLRIVSTAERGAGAPRTVFDNRESSLDPMDWSPDGKWIAGLVRRSDNTAQIGLLNVSDGSLRSLKTVDWSRVGGMRFSPDSSLLAYHGPQQETAFERDVFVIAVNGTDDRKVAASPGDDTVLEWTRDGRRVLIASDRGGSMSIWSVPATEGTKQAPGSGYDLVKSDIGIISSIGPTRDGTLFYNLLPTSSGIYTARYDTASGQLTSAPVQPVQQFKGYTFLPELSGDGRSLVYTSRREIGNPTRNVWSIVSLETGRVVRDLTPPISFGEYSRWSPDGQHLIVRGSDLKGRTGYLKVDATTADILLSVDTCLGIPFLAADGRSFFCYRFDEKQMVQIDSSSGAILRTYSGVTGQPYAASPDGRSVEYFTWSPAGTVLRILSLANGESRDVIMLPGNTWQVGNSLTIDFTPDSRHIVFYGRRNEEAGMWRVPIDGGAPQKINVDVGTIFSWRFNAATGQVAFSTNPVGSGARLELWKMENFLPDAAARR